MSGLDTIDNVHPLHDHNTELEVATARWRRALLEIGEPDEPAPAAIDDKLVATLQARFALAGYVLVPTTDDRDRQVFVVSRWGMCRQLDTVADAEALLKLITGHSGESRE